MFLFEKKPLHMHHVEEAGMYTAQILHANLNNEQTAVCLTVLLDDFYTEAIWIVLTTKKNEPNEYGIDLLNDLLRHFNIEKLKSKTKKLIQLENQTIGILLDLSTNDGYRNINIISFYDAETHQTAFEKDNNVDANYIDKKFNEMVAKYESN